jgi:hypothetical protein
MGATAPIANERGTSEKRNPERNPSWLAGARCAPPLNEPNYFGGIVFEAKPSNGL